MSEAGSMPPQDPWSGTIAVLHPAVERPRAAALAAAGSEGAAAVAHPRLPKPATRPATLAGKRLALFGNGKVNAFEIMSAIGRRLVAAHGVSEAKFWAKPHAAEAGTDFIPDLLRWQPDLVITALGD